MTDFSTFLKFRSLKYYLGPQNIVPYKILVLKHFAKKWREEKHLQHFNQFFCHFFLSVLAIICSTEFIKWILMWNDG